MIGRVTVGGSYSIADTSLRTDRPSLRITALSLPGNALRKSKALLTRSVSQDDGQNAESNISLVSYQKGKQLLSGDTVGIHEYQEYDYGLNSVIVSAGPCWILEVDKGNQSGAAWLVKAETIFRCQQNRDLDMLSYQRKDAWV